MRAAEGPRILIGRGGAVRYPRLCRQAHTGAHPPCRHAPEQRRPGPWLAWRVGLCPAPRGSVLHPAAACMFTPTLPCCSALCTCAHGIALCPVVLQVRTAVGMAVNAIAEWDWPDAWPGLMERLVGAVRERSNENLGGRGRGGAGGGRRPAVGSSVCRAYGQGRGRLAG